MISPERRTEGSLNNFRCDCIIAIIILFNNYSVCHLLLPGCCQVRLGMFLFSNLVFTIANTFSTQKDSKAFLFSFIHFQLCHPLTCNIPIGIINPSRVGGGWFVCVSVRLSVCVLPRNLCKYQMILVC